MAPENTPETPDPKGPATSPPKPRRRLLKTLVAAIVALVLLVALAPTLVSLSIFRPYLLDAANSRLPVGVDAGGWSLSWFGPQEVFDLAISLPDGKPVSTVKHAVVEQGLLGLIGSRTHLGKVTVVGAEVWMQGVAQLRKQIEAETPPQEKPPSPPEKPETPKRAETPPVIPETVSIQDLTVHAETSTIHVLSAELTTGPEQDEFQANVDLEHDGERGNVEMDVDLTGLSSDWRGPKAIGATGTVKGHGIPLAALWAVLADLGLPIEGGGKLWADITFARTRTGELSLEAKCNGQQLWATGDLLHGDRPALESMDLRLACGWAERIVAVKAFELTTPVATAAANGTFGLAAQTEAPTGTGVAKVRLLLAPIARMLPKTLSLHEDLQVEAGTIDVTVDAASDERESRLRLGVVVSDLRGTRGGMPVALSPGRLDLELDRPYPEPPPEPARAERAEFDWLGFAESLRVTKFVLTGAFGTVNASGRLSAFALDARLGNLAKATRELGEFADLKGYGARGAATARVRTEGSLDDALRLVVASNFRDLRLDLGEGRSWQEPQADLSAKAKLAFGPKRELVGAAVEHFTLTGEAGRLDGDATATLADGAWTFSVKTNGSAAVSNLASLADLALPLAVAEEQPAEGADAQERGVSAGGLEALLHRAAQAEGWLDIGATAEGTLGESVAVALDASLADVVMPIQTTKEGEVEPAGEPLRVPAASVRTALRYEFGDVGRLTINNLVVTGPGVSATVQGPTTLALAGPATTLEGNPEAAIAVDLAQLAQTLAPLKWLPKDASLAGTVEANLSAAAVQDSRTTAKFSAVGKGVSLTWADGRSLNEPYMRASAEATLVRDEAGAAGQVDVKSWSVSASPGEIKGTVVATRKADAWDYRVDATGEGVMKPLARTLASLQGRPPQPLRGQWQMTGSYERSTGKLQLTASGTNLAIAQEDGPAAPEVRLDDIRLKAAAVVAEEGLIQIERADLSGPGIAVVATGQLRLPTKPGAMLAADGDLSVDGKSLEDFSQLLLAFGLLPADADLAGTMAFEGKLGRTADGLSGKGQLDVAGLRVRLPQTKGTLREPEAHVPIGFAYETGKRRWDVVVKDMKGKVVSGTFRVALTHTDADDLLQARWELAVDAAHLREALGESLPASVRLSGPIQLVGQVAGPLPREVAQEKATDAAPGPGQEAPSTAMPWHTRIAGLEGNGSVAITRFEYETLSGGPGALQWQMADGRVLLNPDPEHPSRLSVAGGTVNLGGWIDLRGPTPRLVIADRLQAVDGLPVGGDEIKGYLKYVSPVLAASVSATGRFSMAVDSLDMPLVDGAARKTTATGTYRIDDFQTELIGPLGRLVRYARAEPQTVRQTFGPVAVRMSDGVMHVEEHDLQYSEDVRLRFGGSIDVEKRMKVIVGVPVSDAMLERFKVSETAKPYLADTVLAVPLEGTIDNPELDEKAFAKRLGNLAMEAIKRQTLEKLGDWLKGETPKP